MIKVIFFIFILSFSAWSEDLYLFLEDGNFNNHFSENILSGDLEYGERIFLDNKVVIFKGILGSGNTTLILEVLDTANNERMALRLPHGNSEKNFDINDGKRFINYTFEGYKELERAKIPIPKIHSYHKDSFLLVDLIEHDFNLKTFLARNELMNEEIKDKVLSSLLLFAKKSANYESIGDFHLEQLVYSIEENEWFLLDWSSKHQLARLPSSQTLFKSEYFIKNNVALDKKGEEILSFTSEGHIKSVKRDVTDFEKEVIKILAETIQATRTEQMNLDEIELVKIKNKLKELNRVSDILDIYQKIDSSHLGSFYTLLQKDFIENQLIKFPKNTINLQELKLLLDNLGQFTPFYFSRFTEKIITSINDIETFMFLYHRVNTIGLDEEIEDDIAIAISKNIERILSNSYSSPENINNIKKLKDDFGLINYRSREILSRSEELLKPNENCHEIMTVFF